MAVIETHSLSKSYKAIEAVRWLDVSVEKNIFGLPGPENFLLTARFTSLTARNP